MVGNGSAGHRGEGAGPEDEAGVEALAAHLREVREVWRLEHETNTNLRSLLDDATATIEAKEAVLACMANLGSAADLAPDQFVRRAQESLSQLLQASETTLFTRAHAGDGVTLAGGGDAHDLKLPAASELAAHALRTGRAVCIPNLEELQAELAMSGGTGARAARSRREEQAVGGGPVDPLSADRVRRDPDLHNAILRHAAARPQAGGNAGEEGLQRGAKPGDGLRVSQLATGPRSTGSDSPESASEQGSGTFEVSPLRASPPDRARGGASTAAADAGAESTVFRYSRGGETTRARALAVLALPLRRPADNSLTGVVLTARELSDRPQFGAGYGLEQGPGVGEGEGDGAFSARDVEQLEAVTGPLAEALTRVQAQAALQERLEQASRDLARQQAASTSEAARHSDASAALRRCLLSLAFVASAGSEDGNERDACAHAAASLGPALGVRRARLYLPSSRSGRAAALHVALPPGEDDEAGSSPAPDAVPLMTAASDVDQEHPYLQAPEAEAYHTASTVRASDGSGQFLLCVPITSRWPQAEKAGADTCAVSGVLRLELGRGFALGEEGASGPRPGPLVDDDSLCAASLALHALLLRCALRSDLAAERSALAESRAHAASLEEALREETLARRRAEEEDALTCRLVDVAAALRLDAPAHEVAARLEDEARRIAGADQATLLLRTPSAGEPAVGSPARCPARRRDSMDSADSGDWGRRSPESGGEPSSPTARTVDSDGLRAMFAPESSAAQDGDPEKDFSPVHALAAPALPSGGAVYLGAGGPEGSGPDVSGATRMWTLARDPGGDVRTFRVHTLPVAPGSLLADACAVSGPGAEGGVVHVGDASSDRRFRGEFPWHSPDYRTGECALLPLWAAADGVEEEPVPTGVLVVSRRRGADGSGFTASALHALRRLAVAAAPRVETWLDGCALRAAGEAERVRERRAGTQAHRRRTELRRLLSEAQTALEEEEAARETADAEVASARAQCEAAESKAFTLEEEMASLRAEVDTLRERQLQVAQGSETAMQPAERPTERSAAASASVGEEERRVQWSSPRLAPTTPRQGAGSPAPASSKNPGLQVDVGGAAGDVGGVYTRSRGTGMTPRFRGSLRQMDILREEAEEGEGGEEDSGVKVGRIAAGRGLAPAPSSPWLRSPSLSRRRPRSRSPDRGAKGAASARSLTRGASRASELARAVAALGDEEGEEERASSLDGLSPRAGGGGGTGPAPSPARSARMPAAFASMRSLRQDLTPQKSRTPPPTPVVSGHAATARQRSRRSAQGADTGAGTPAPNGSSAGESALVVATPGGTDEGEGEGKGEGEGRGRAEKTARLEEELAEAKAEVERVGIELAECRARHEAAEEKARQGEALATAVVEVAAAAGDRGTATATLRAVDSAEEGRATALERAVEEAGAGVVLSRGRAALSADGEDAALLEAAGVDKSLDLRPASVGHEEEGEEGAAAQGALECLPPLALVRAIEAQAQRVVDCESVWLHVVDPDSRGSLCAYHPGPGPRASSGHSPLLSMPAAAAGPLAATDRSAGERVIAAHLRRTGAGDGLVGWSVRVGEAARASEDELAHGWGAGSRFSAEVDGSSEFRTRSLLVVPVPGAQGGRPIAVLRCLNRRAGQHGSAQGFSGADEAAVRKVAVAASLALRHLGGAARGRQRAWAARRGALALLASAHGMHKLRSSLDAASSAADASAALLLDLALTDGSVPTRTAQCGRLAGNALEQANAAAVAAAAMEEPVGWWSAAALRHWSRTSAVQQATEAVTEGVSAAPAADTVWERAGPVARAVNKHAAFALAAREVSLLLIRGSGPGQRILVALGPGGEERTHPWAAGLPALALAAATGDGRSWGDAFERVVNGAHALAGNTSLVSQPGVADSLAEPAQRDALPPLVIAHRGRVVALTAGNDLMHVRSAVVPPRGRGVYASTAVCCPSTGRILGVLTFEMSDEEEKLEASGTVLHSVLPSAARDTLPLGDEWEGGTPQPAWAQAGSDEPILVPPEGTAAASRGLAALIGRVLTSGRGELAALAAAGPAAWLRSRADASDVALAALGRLSATALCTRADEFQAAQRRVASGPSLRAVAAAVASEAPPGLEAVMRAAAAGTSVSRSPPPVLPHSDADMPVLVRCTVWFVDTESGTLWTVHPASSSRLLARMDISSWLAREATARGRARGEGGDNRSSPVPSSPTSDEGARGHGPLVLRALHSRGVVAGVEARLVHTAGGDAAAPPPQRKPAGQRRSPVPRRSASRPHLGRDLDMGSLVDEEVESRVGGGGSVGRRSRSAVHSQSRTLGVDGRTLSVEAWEALEAVRREDEDGLAPEFAVPVPTASAGGDGRGRGGEGAGSRLRRWREARAPVLCAVRCQPLETPPPALGGLSLEVPDASPPLGPPPELLRDSGGAPRLGPRTADAGGQHDRDCSSGTPDSRPAASSSGWRGEGHGVVPEAEHGEEARDAGAGQTVRDTLPSVMGVLEVVCTTRGAIREQMRRWRALRREAKAQAASSHARRRAQARWRSKKREAEEEERRVQELRELSKSRRDAASWREALRGERDVSSVSSDEEEGGEGDMPLPEEWSVSGSDSDEASARPGDEEAVAGLPELASRLAGDGGRETLGMGLSAPCTALCGQCARRAVELRVARVVMAHEAVLSRRARRAARSVRETAGQWEDALRRNVSVHDDAVAALQRDLDAARRDADEDTASTRREAEERLVRELRAAEQRQEEAVRVASDRAAEVQEEIRRQYNARIEALEQRMEERVRTEQEWRESEVEEVRQRLKEADEAAVKDEQRHAAALRAKEEEAERALASALAEASQEREERLEQLRQEHVDEVKDLCAVQEEERVRLRREAAAELERVKAEGEARLAQVQEEQGAEVAAAARRHEAEVEETRLAHQQEVEELDRRRENELAEAERERSRQVADLSARMTASVEDAEEERERRVQEVTEAAEREREEARGRYEEELREEEARWRLRLEEAEGRHAKEMETTAAEARDRIGALEEAHARQMEDLRASASQAEEEAVASSTKAVRTRWQKRLEAERATGRQRVALASALLAARSESAVQELVAQLAPPLCADLIPASTESDAGRAPGTGASSASAGEGGGAGAGSRKESRTRPARLGVWGRLLVATPASAVGGDEDSEGRGEGGAAAQGTVVMPSSTPSSGFVLCGQGGQWQNAYALPLGPGVCGRVALGGSPAVVGDVLTSGDYERSVDGVADPTHGTRSLMVLPVPNLDAAARGGQASVGGATHWHASSAAVDALGVLPRHSGRHDTGGAPATPGPCHVMVVGCAVPEAFSSRDAEDWTALARHAGAALSAARAYRRAVAQSGRAFSELDAVQHELQARERELAACREEVAAAETELDAVKQNAETSGERQHARLLALEAEVRRTKTQRRRDADVAEQRAAQAEARVADAEGRADRFESLAADVQRSLTAAQEELREQSTSCEALRVRSEALEERLREREQSLAQSCEALDAAREELRARERSLAESREAMEVARRRLQQVEQEKAAAEQQAAQRAEDLGKWRDEAKHSGSSAERASARIAELCAERDDLWRRAEEAEERVASIQEQLEDMAGQVRDLTGRVREARDEAQKRRQDAEQARNEAAEWSREAGLLREEVARAQDERDSAQGRAAAAERRLHAVSHMTRLATAPTAAVLCERVLDLCPDLGELLRRTVFYVLDSNASELWTVAPDTRDRTVRCSLEASGLLRRAIDTAAVQRGWRDVVDDPLAMRRSVCPSAGAWSRASGAALQSVLVIPVAAEAPSGGQQRIMGVLELLGPVRGSDAAEGAVQGREFGADAGSGQPAPTPNASTISPHSTPSHHTPPRGRRHAPATPMPTPAAFAARLTAARGLERGGLDPSVGTLGEDEESLGSLLASHVAAAAELCLDRATLEREAEEGQARVRQEEQRSKEAVAAAATERALVGFVHTALTARQATDPSTFAFFAAVSRAAAAAVGGAHAALWMHDERHMQLWTRVGPGADGAVLDASNFPDHRRIEKAGSVQGSGSREEGDGEGKEGAHNRPTGGEEEEEEKSGGREGARPGLGLPATDTKRLLSRICAAPRAHRASPSAVVQITLEEHSPISFGDASLLPGEESESESGPARRGGGASEYLAVRCVETGKVVSKGRAEAGRALHRTVVSSMREAQRYHPGVEGGSSGPERGVAEESGTVAAPLGQGRVSVLCVPILGPRRNVIGVLEAARDARRAAAPFGRVDERALLRLANLVRASLFAASGACGPGRALVRPMEALRRELEQSRRRAAESKRGLQQRAAKAEQRATQLYQELRDAAHMLRQAREEKNSAREELRRAHEQVEAAREAAEAAGRRAEDAVSREGQVRGELQAVQVDADQAATELERTRSALREKERRVEDAEGQLRELTESHAQREEGHDVQARALVARAQHSEKEAQGAKEEVRAKTREMEHLRDECQRLAQRCAELNAHVAGYKERVTYLLSLQTQGVRSALRETSA